MANVNGCWNWFDTRNGRGHVEAAVIMRAIDQACLYGADRTRVAIAGLSAGASMAALVVTRYPDRFQAVAMHSGVPPGTARTGLGALSAMYGHGNTKPLEADDYRARRRVVATLVEIPRLGHAWSGGAASQSYSDPQGPDASRLIWAFASRQFRSVARV